ncbi:NADH-quinone oxidoreductase subunit C [Methylobacillus gramineus]|uniref:NADH-quinone oxidoreductase subunit C n=1 Tax=Methylobacillus gramineus TaxID=755169 RepID=UPI001CFFFF35|nr:NADH-quinone oxidoreductase subunit C [Methylobacillus gramineus]MCB5183649.1 NADH-quinone oxidoreductase subunit C [Methylobacillus gramineus]
MTRLSQLKENLQQVLGDKLSTLVEHVDELTIECKPGNLLEVCSVLRDHSQLKFEQLIDLCGVDYADYGEGTWSGLRFATVYHFLSISLNHRVRLRVFASEDDFPVLPTLVDLWSVANWFERESFDLYGIMYEGHPDLRRLLTDYGFIGHPFRKDFPMIGNVEMRYDPEQQRVIYQPVTIDPRNNVPRVIRQEGFHHG